jgi:Flp pilus assembly protein TadB
MQFFWRTAKVIYLWLAILLFGSVSLLFSGYTIASGIVLYFATSLFLLWVIKVAQHRRRLDLLNNQANVRNIIHNAPQGLPEEQAGVEYVRYIFDNPIQ